MRFLLLFTDTRKRAFINGLSLHKMSLRCLLHEDIHISNHIDMAYILTKY